MRDDYLIELGRIVFNAGLLENSIRGALLKLAKNNYGIARVLILPNYSTSQKLDLMDRLTSFTVDKEYLLDWKTLINETRELFALRNSIFHGMPGVDEDKLIIASVKKGKKGKIDYFEERTLEIDTLKDINNKLSSGVILKLVEN
jgi:hypothetical protein